MLFKYSQYPALLRVKEQKDLMDIKAFLESLVLEAHMEFQDNLVVKDQMVKRDYLVFPVEMVIMVLLVMMVIPDCQDYQVPLEVKKDVLNLMELI